MKLIVLWHRQTRLNCNAIKQEQLKEKKKKRFDTHLSSAFTKRKGKKMKEQNAQLRKKKDTKELKPEDRLENGKYQKPSFRRPAIENS